MPPSMHQVVYSCKLTPMEIGTHAPTCPNHLEQQNETTTSTTENSSPSFVALKPGTTTCKDRHPQYRSSPTTKTSPSSNKPRSSTEGKPNGCWTLLTMILNSYMYPEANSAHLMPYPDDPISSQKLTRITKESPSFPHPYSLIS